MPDALCASCARLAAQDLDLAPFCDIQPKMPDDEMAAGTAYDLWMYEWRGLTEAHKLRHLDFAAVVSPSAPFNKPPLVAMPPGSRSCLHLHPGEMVICSVRGSRRRRYQAAVRRCSTSCARGGAMPSSCGSTGTSAGLAPSH